MENKKIIHALIPARGGSKGIPKKNSKLYKNIPLVAHSILLAKKLVMCKKIIVSTDCPEIKKIALEYGAEVPFLRPSNISGDFSTDLEVFQHYLFWLEFAKEEKPDILLHLRPTYPERNISFINKCVNLFLENINQYDSLRTVVPIKKSPFKMYTLENKELKPLFPKYKYENSNQNKELKEPYNQVRQILPQCYLHNGCFDIVKRKIIENNSMSGNHILPVIMKDNFDIDSEEDWKKSCCMNKTDD
jgi:CMP-N,N'-diacetyllegionaminic acid synthase